MEEIRDDLAIAFDHVISDEKMYKVLEQIGCSGPRELLENRVLFYQVVTLLKIRRDMLQVKLLRMVERESFKKIELKREK